MWFLMTWAWDIAHRMRKLRNNWLEVPRFALILIDSELADHELLRSIATRCQQPQSGPQP